VPRAVPPTFGDLRSQGGRIRLVKFSPARRVVHSGGRHLTVPALVVTFPRPRSPISDHPSPPRPVRGCAPGGTPRPPATRPKPAFSSLPAAPACPGSRPPAPWTAGSPPGISVNLCFSRGRVRRLFASPQPSAPLGRRTTTSEHTSWRMDGHHTTLASRPRLLPIRTQDLTNHITSRLGAEGPPN
jgi:hypothetical protein